jgi:hypothetical protein
MKKITFFIFLAFLVISTSKAFAYDHLYVVGNASPAGWDPGAAPEMTLTEPGIFTWTGTLSDNSGDGGQRRFKFLTARSWDTSLTCQITTPGHRLISSGIEENLFVRTSSGEDNAFQVSETAVYTIVVNTNTMKMTCTKEGDLPGDIPDLTQLYIVGNATTAGWDPAAALEMTRIENGVFTWVGDLTADGELKFINQRGSWNKTINPTSIDLYFDNGVEYDLNFRPTEESPDDFKFIVSTTGMYIISVNLNTMRIVINPATVDLSQLYLVGSATAAGWDNASALEMIKIQDGIFSWTGDLSADGEFKFLNERGNWSKTINPQGADVLFVEGTEYSLNYRPLEASPNDFKFKVTNAGTYNVSVNLIEMKAVIQQSTRVDSEKDTDISNLIRTKDKAVYILNPGSTEIQLVAIYDVTGKVLNKISNVSGNNILLANNLPAGIYIIKAEINSKKHVQKVAL